MSATLRQVVIDSGAPDRLDREALHPGGQGMSPAAVMLWAIAFWLAMVDLALWLTGLMA